MNLNNDISYSLSIHISSVQSFSGDFICKRKLMISLLFHKYFAEFLNKIVF